MKTRDETKVFDVQRVQRQGMSDGSCGYQRVGDIQTMVKSIIAQQVQVNSGNFLIHLDLLKRCKMVLDFAQLALIVCAKIKLRNGDDTDRYFSFANGCHGIGDRLVSIQELDQDVRIAQDQVYVWSDELRIAGFADVVEESPVSGLDTASDASTSLSLRSTRSGLLDQRESRELIPVEYKKGRMGKWLNDHIQLCAQALCIAEKTGAVTPKGYIFYFGSRHREEVEFTPELRQRTVMSIERAHQIVAAHRLPLPLENYNKCRDCSLERICLPREVKILREKL